MQVLYENAAKRQWDHYKFLAALQGVDLEKGKEKGRVQASEAKTDEERKLESLKFGKPEDYEGMSEEEKEELTQKMMGQWMNWAGKKMDLEAIDRRGVSDG